MTMDSAAVSVPASATPLVSVVMVSYKEIHAKLTRSIDSILTQTISDLELIIVFEKGDPNIAFLRETYSDPRIVIIENQDQRHRNICHNLGLSAARGRYIARLDSDDWTRHDRLAMEVDFLRRNPDITLVGSAGRLVDKRGKEVGFRHFPQSPRDVLRAIALTTPFFHSAVLWDRDRAGHDLRYSMHPLDDLDIYLQMIERGCKLANLPDVLIDYDQPDNYSRPMFIHRDSFKVRIEHWKVGFKDPFFFGGIVARGLLALLPLQAIDVVTGRNKIADWLRSVRA